MAIYNSASGDFRLFETAEILSLRFDEPCHCVTISTFLSNSISLLMKENCFIGKIPDNTMSRENIFRPKMKPTS